MKKYLHYIIIISSFILVLTSCNSLNELSIDPNLMQTVTGTPKQRDSSAQPENSLLPSSTSEKVFKIPEKMGEKLADERYRGIKNETPVKRRKLKGIFIGEDDHEIKYVSNKCSYS